MSRLEPYVKVIERMVDFPTRLSIDGSSNIGITIVAPTGPQLALIQGPNEFLANYTVDGLTIPRDAHISFINAYYLSFFSSLVVSRSMNSDVQGAAIITLKSNALAVTKSYYKDGLELSTKNVLSVTAIPVDRSNFGFMLDDVIYYGGDYDAVCAALRATTGTGQEVVTYDVDFTTYEAVAVDTLAEDTITTSDIINCIASEINKRGNYVAIVKSGTIELYRDQNTDKAALDKTNIVNSDGELIEVNVTPVTVTASMTADTPTATLPSDSKRLFTILVNDAGTAGVDSSKVTISKSRVFKNHKIFDLTLAYGIKDPETYVVSLDMDAVDSSEVNCYIDTLNTMRGLDFSIEVNDGDKNDTWTTGVTQVGFGEGFIDAAASASTPYLKSALDVLDDQENYDIAYLAPCGITSVPYVKTMISLGIKRKWFSPCDVPYDRTNANSIAAYGANIQDDYNTYMCGPFDKNIGLTGWVNYIAGTTLYYERVMSNKALNNEFAPVFDAETGRVNYTNPVKLLQKSQREQLISLGLPINYVLWDQSVQGYYFNDNWTHFSQSEAVLGEENNVRMLHKISRDLEKVYKQFKAKQNSDQTRQKVIDITNLYFQSEIMGQVTHPAEYLVICDRSNNTDAIINARKLAITVKVRMYNSIKYITVINEAYSVGGASFTE
jgi:hypothetical protein